MSISSAASSADLPRHGALLRRLWNAVDVRAECDHRLARPPACGPRGGNAGDPLLDGEAVLLQDVGEILRRLDFLEAELAEAENRVIPFLNVLLHRVDLEADVPLVLIQLRVGGRSVRGRRLGRLRRVKGYGDADGGRQC